jgi:hypothetical protein
MPICVLDRRPSRESSAFVTRGQQPERFAAKKHIMRKNEQSSIPAFPFLRLLRPFAAIAPQWVHPSRPSLLRLFAAIPLRDCRKEAPNAQQ